MYRITPWKRYLLTCIIAFISFLLYSPDFYPLLNSDDALNVLMAFDYHLPADIYCWGQDRGGTLIPLMSQVFIQPFTISPVTAVSLSNYLLLVIGYIGFSSLLHRRSDKLIFAVLWFLPFVKFVDLARYPLGMEYSLIGASLCLINRHELQSHAAAMVKQLRLLLIVLLLIAALWVSDLAVVSIFVLLAVLVYHRVGIAGKKLNIRTLVTTLAGILLAILFIRYAKSIPEVPVKDYTKINSLHGFIASLIIVAGTINEMLFFKTGNPFSGIFCWLAIAFLAVLLVLLWRKRAVIALLRKKWPLFFLADLAVIMAVLLSSVWVLKNGTGRWYFVAPYISATMAVLLIMEHLDGYLPEKSALVLRIFLGAIAVTGALSPLYALKYIRPETLKPKTQVFGELRQLGRIGIIGAYWNSYIAAVPDPGMIKATPHDQSSVRSQALADSVLSRENIYVVRDTWLNEFPDTLIQFGTVLVKNGDPFTMAGNDLCRYRKGLWNKTFTLNDLKYDTTFAVTRLPSGGKMLTTTRDCNTCRDKYLVYGPYTDLGKGSYTVTLQLQASGISGNNPFIKIDVSANAGKLKLAEKKFSKADLKNETLTNPSLDFTTRKRMRKVEFRVYYYGNADVRVEGVRLRERRL